MKKIVRKVTKYVINGREYHSLDEMPEADRQFFMDANQNGIPDGMEKLMAAAKDGTPPKLESSVQHYEIVQNTVVSPSGGTLPPNLMADVLDAEAAPVPPVSSLPPLRQPLPDKPTVSFSLDLKTLVIIGLLGVIAILLVVLVMNSR